MQNTIDILGDQKTAEMLVEGTITELVDERITYIGFAGFQGCSKLTKLELPSLETVGAQCVYECGKLTSVSFPNLKNIDSYSISSLTSLKSLSLPSLVEAPGYSMSRNGIEKIEFRDIQKLNGSAFGGSNYLKTVIFRGTQMCELTNRSSLASSIKFYVKNSVLATYKADTEWGNLSDRIFAIEDYPDICG